MYLIYFSYAHSFFVKTDYRTVNALARMPCGKRIWKPAFAQVVLVFMNDKRPTNHGKLPLKQRDFGSGKMKRAITFLSGGDISEISSM